MTISQALYYYLAPPLLFILGYLLCWTRKREVPPDPYRRGELPGVEPGWYPPTPTRDEDAPFKLARLLRRVKEQDAKEAPTTKREWAPRPGSVDKEAP